MLKALKSRRCAFDNPLTCLWPWPGPSCPCASWTAGGLDWAQLKQRAKQQHLSCIICFISIISFILRPPFCIWELDSMTLFQLAVWVPAALRNYQHFEFGRRSCCVESRGWSFVFEGFIKVRKLQIDEHASIDPVCWTNWRHNRHVGCTDCC